MRAPEGSKLHYGKCPKMLITLFHTILAYFYAPPPKKWRGIMLYPLKF